MESFVNAWKNATTRIFTGVLMFSFSGIIGGLLAGVTLISGSLGGVMWLSGLVGIIMIVGYVLYIGGLSDLQRILSTADASSISKVKTAVILLIIGSCVSTLFSLVPLLGTVVGAVISGVLNLIGCILCVMAFAALKKSQTFPQSAMGGITKLYLAYLLNLIGYIAAITIVLALFTPILNLISFIFVLIGWSALKNAEVTEPAA